MAATQVYELTVDKNFRRSGHASRLLSAVADLTSGQLRAWVGVDDEERQRFYTSAGFAPRARCECWVMASRSTCGGPSATKGPRRERRHVGACVVLRPPRGQCAPIARGRAYHGAHEQHSSPPLRIPRSRHGHADDPYR